jgi:hypothetical protein
LEAVRVHGVCRLHRRSFAPVRAAIDSAAPGVANVASAAGTAAEFAA